MQQAARNLFARLGIVMLLCPLSVQAELPSRVQHANLAASAPQARLDEPITPIPLSVSVNEKKVKLGKRLFEERRLSKNGAMACVNCHYLDKGGTDNLAFSRTLDGGYRTRNTPTILNIGLYRLLGWEGNRMPLADLVGVIVESKAGLAGDWENIVSFLNSDPYYRGAFAELYRDGVQVQNINDAIAEYLTSLITPNSRFDRYLRGDNNAISAEEKRGYQLFKTYGCSSCHQGVAVGGNMVAPFSLFGNYLSRTKLEPDVGRYRKTGVADDKYLFRVPSLRNIELTAPYFHDASAATLHEAVDVMGRYMLGRDVPDEDTELLVLFLKTLTAGQEGKRP